MRATKGLWAALGAGVSLAAAALIVLATMSVVLAVGGWPRGHTISPQGSVELQAQRAAQVARSSAPTVAGTRSAARRRRHPAAAPRATRHAAPKQQAVRRALTPTAGTQVTAPAIAPSRAPATPSSGSGGAAVTAPVTKATGSGGSAVTNLTSTLGQALDPVSPPVADSVTAVGQQAGQTIDQAGQTAGGVAGGLTGLG